MCSGVWKRNKVEKCYCIAVLCIIWYSIYLSSSLSFSCWPSLCLLFYLNEWVWPHTSHDGNVPAPLGAGFEFIDFPPQYFVIYLAIFLSSSVVLYSFLGQAEAWLSISSWNLLKLFSVWLATVPKKNK